MALLKWSFFTGKNTAGVFIHLLPRAKAWWMVVDRPVRQFFQALSNALVDTVRDAADLVNRDLFPATTRELRAWGLQWGLPNNGLSEADQRVRLAGRWSAKGGQSPRYLQDTLQGDGFNVFIHEWWVPASDPPIARNPNVIVTPDGIGCGEAIAECGEPIMECGEGIYGSAGRLLVNKIYTPFYIDSMGCGEPLMECGEPGAGCGEYSDLLFLRKKYTVPPDETLWPFFLYIGGETFGTQADVPADRIEEFEDRCLQICPDHLWLVLMINET